jgi:hypothetical protein
VQADQKPSGSNQALIWKAGGGFVWDKKACGDILPSPGRDTLLFCRDILPSRE